MFTKDGSHWVSSYFRPCAVCSSVHPLMFILMCSCYFRVREAISNSTESSQTNFEGERCNCTVSIAQVPRVNETIFDIPSNLIYSIVSFYFRAQSGTGKTATFSISILQSLDTQIRETQALVLSPTRELATQIQKVNLLIW